MAVKKFTKDEYNALPTTAIANVWSRYDVGGKPYCTDGAGNGYKVEFKEPVKEIVPVESNPAVRDLRRRVEELEAEPPVDISNIVAEMTGAAVESIEDRLTKLEARVSELERRKPGRPPKDEAN